MGVVLALLVFIILLPLLFLFYRDWNNYWQIVRRLPGPTPLPLLGNVHQVGQNAHVVLNSLFKWWTEYGKTNFYVLVGPLPNIVLTEVKDIEYVLTSNKMLKKSEVYDMLHPWLGQGLLTATGTHWLKHRKMITPSFHFAILQDFFEVMNRNSTKFIAKLKKAAEGEGIFDIQAQIPYFALDVICETAMGIEINAMDNPKSELVTAFKIMCENIQMRAFNPLKRNNNMYKLAPDYPKFARNLKILTEFTHQVIEKRIQTFEHDKKQPETINYENVRKKKAFLDNLLTATIDGKPLSRQEIFEEVSTFIFEGFDTTTSGIAFGTYALSRHPEVQRKVFEEQKDILNAKLQDDATYQEITEMKYLDLVIKEVERLYPSVPIFGRQAEEDYNINGTFIPKGCSVLVFGMAMGYREETFEDVYRFDPERFNSIRDAEKLNPYSYIPFSAGPRNCIGQKFAVLEMKTILSKIVRNFEVLPPLDELVSKDGYVQHYYGLTEAEARKRYKPNKYDPKLSSVLTLKSDNGILVRLRERKNKI